MNKKKWEAPELVEFDPQKYIQRNSHTGTKMKLRAFILLHVLSFIGVVICLYLAFDKSLHHNPYWILYFIDSVLFMIVYTFARVNYFRVMENKH